MDIKARIQNLVREFSVDEDDDDDAGSDESCDKDNDEYFGPMLKYLRGLAHNINYDWMY